jgi:hypothetical protein
LEFDQDVSLAFGAVLFSGFTLPAQTVVLVGHPVFTPPNSNAPIRNAIFRSGLLGEGTAPLVKRRKAHTLDHGYSSDPSDLSGCAGQLVLLDRTEKKEKMRCRNKTPNSMSAAGGTVEIRGLT